ncbi:MAG: hypothetical protein R8K50_08010 [Mariprofundus sp.]
MEQLESHLPFTADSLACLTGIELAILDQFITRFSKLQDVIGAKLFPSVLELTKEPGDLTAFIDKLNRLEKIGAIKSAKDWLLLREMRNAFSHEYPDDPDMQAAILNRAFLCAKGLLSSLDELELFARRYLPGES